MLWFTRYFFFFVFPSCGKMNNFPYPNHGFLRFSRHTWSDWPCTLLIVIEKANRTWNCNRLNSNGMSVGIAWRRGMRTSSPFHLPFRIVASMTLSIKFFNSKCSSIAHSRWIDVAKKNYGHINILSDNICCGTPGMSSELKNSFE